MKINRTKNTIRNVMWGGTNKLITMFGPFLVQTTIIKTLGMEYNGLTGLFSSILNVINLAELGIGTAIVYSMYKGIANDDTTLICALLSFYKKVYRIIGGVVFLAGLIAMALLKIIIPEDLPGGLNVYFIYLICLSNVVLSYNFFAYQQSILNALQLTSIIDRYRAMVNCVIYFLQIILLLNFKNYYFYVTTLPFQSVITNYVLFKRARRQFPKYVPDGEISFDERQSIIKKTKALFFYKIGGTVLVSVDSIVISSILGLHTLGQYNSYYYVVNALTGFIVILFNSMTAGIGNSIAVETVGKNYYDFSILFFLYRWVMGWVTTTLLCLYEPFMRVWIGPEEMFPFGIMICFVVYFYFMQIGNVLNMYKDAGGLWEYDKWRPLVAAGVNLILNMSFVRLMGIYAIILSTIISIVFIILPWSTYVTFKHYFVTGLKDYIVMIVQGIVCTVITSVVTLNICESINIEGIIGIILRLILTFFISNTLYFLMFSRMKHFISAQNWFKIKLRRE